MRTDNCLCPTCTRRGQTDCCRSQSGQKVLRRSAKEMLCTAMQRTQGLSSSRDSTTTLDMLGMPSPLLRWQKRDVLNSIAIGRMKPSGRDEARFVGPSDLDNVCGYNVGV
jgi:hypothetical protein